MWKMWLLSTAMRIIKLKKKTMMIMTHLTMMMNRTVSPRRKKRKGKHPKQSNEQVFRNPLPFTVVPKARSNWIRRSPPNSNCFKKRIPSHNPLQRLVYHHLIHHISLHSIINKDNNYYMTMNSTADFTIHRRRIHIILADMILPPKM